MEINSDLLEVSWTNRWFEPEASARRSQIQRIRHSEDSAFHEKALGNLEKGRLNEWKEEQILEAIRCFKTSHGRPPRYEELRGANGLPDYKTIWRKFGSSRTAIAQAIGQDTEKLDQAAPRDSTNFVLRWGCQVGSVWRRLGPAGGEIEIRLRD